MTDPHPTKGVRHPRGHLIPIDIRIAPLIGSLWAQGYRTSNSCQDNYVFSCKTHKDVHFVWIEFEGVEDGRRFIREYIDDDLDHYNDVVTKWELTVNLENSNIHYYEEDGEEYAEDKLPLDLRFFISVRFPVKRLEKVEQVFIGKKEDLSLKTRAVLYAMAKERSLPVKTGMRKADIIELLESSSQ